MTTREQNRHRRAGIIKGLLRFRLGDKCARCGAMEKLHFDVVLVRLGNGERHHRAGSIMRLHFYLDQFKKGNLQLLCEKCNTSKGNSEDRLPW